MAEGEEVVYFVVNNIPVHFRSADLRNYFSQFIESGGFSCFHYRHRPEVRVSAAGAEGAEGASAGAGAGARCCVVAVRADAVARFNVYAHKEWINSQEESLRERCIIRKIKVSEQTGTDEFPYKTRAELKRPVAHTECFTRAHLKALPELNPPALMPAGNVGTPVSVFLQLIQACRLPPRLIRKLGLKFPKTGSNRRYGNVPYRYGSTDVVTPAVESVFTGGGAEISGPGRVAPPKSEGESGATSGKTADREESEEEEEGDEEQSGPDDDDDRCEEWERHEALHEDVTSQERTKERLYEEEIELKWEKGGSGLVFYTDAQFWQEEEEGDFDEQTADDWDVDMSVYYERDGGDMDSRDYVAMRRERRLREGLEERRIGNFEKFTKGVGRRVMEKQGWKDGEGLGHSSSGIPEALENEGQHPSCKRGFGYHGEKLSTFLPARKRKTDFLISTVYDKPRDADQGDSLLRRQPPTSMKYTHPQPGGSTAHTD